MRSVLPDNQVICNLIASRTRVAPLKTVSVPRLELQAAALLTSLIDRIAQNLQISSSDIHCFTDSTVVLCWLFKPSNNWKPYVANHVSKITNLVAFTQWHYVPTNANPSDLATLGISCANFLKCKMWLHGPEFLYSNNPFEAHVIPNLDTHTSLECQKIAGTFATFKQPSIILQFSSYKHLILAIGYMRRFKFKIVDKLNFNTVALTKSEFDSAHFTAVRLVQRSYFGADIDRLKEKLPLKRKCSLSKFYPFLDGASVLRIGGRLEKSSFSPDKKHPILLPAKSHFALLLVRYVHERYFHAGRQFLEPYFTSQYWFVGGRTNLIKKVCAQCVNCCRFRKQTSEQLMGQLPAARLTASHPFAYVGVDLAGPFDCKCVGHWSTIKHKAYLALFICLTTRAVHLELVSDLTSARFLECLQRFISRRRTPVQLSSDNATNFQGARNFFIANAEKFTSFATCENFEWRFIPPRVPHHGGIWEADIRSAKTFLLKCTKGITLMFEEYVTLFSRIEAVLNSRPLCYNEHISQEAEVLTPGHFIIGRPFTSVLSLDADADQQISLPKRLEIIRISLMSFWRIWSKSYINQLRRKWKTTSPNLAVGQIVLIKEDTPPFQWPLGVIVAVYPGAGGLVRVVDVRMRDNVLKRSVSKIVVLPVADAD